MRIHPCHSQGNFTSYWGLQVTTFWRQCEYPKDFCEIGARLAALLWGTGAISLNGKLASNILARRENSFFSSRRSWKRLLAGMLPPSSSLFMQLAHGEPIVFWIFWISGLHTFENLADGLTDGSGFSPVGRCWCLGGKKYQIEVFEYVMTHLSLRYLHTHRIVDFTIPP